MDRAYCSKDSLVFPYYLPDHEAIAFKSRCNFIFFF